MQYQLIKVSPPSYEICCTITLPYYYDPSIPFYSDGEIVFYVSFVSLEPFSSILDYQKTTEFLAWWISSDGNRIAVSSLGSQTMYDIQISPITLESHFEIDYVRYQYLTGRGLTYSPLSI